MAVSEQREPRSRLSFLSSIPPWAQGILAAIIVATGTVLLNAWRSEIRLDANTERIRTLSETAAERSGQLTAHQERLDAIDRRIERLQATDERLFRHQIEEMRELRRELSARSTRQELKELETPPQQRRSLSPFDVP